jgi:hypothetical protein
MPRDLLQLPQGRRSTYVPRINRNRTASSPRVPRRGVGLASASHPRDMRAAWTLARRTPSTRARTLLSNVYTDAKGETMNSPWRFAAPPANSTNPNQACKLWGLAPVRPSAGTTGFSAISSAVGCMLALPTVAEKSPGQGTAPPCEVRFSSGNPRARDLRSQDTREPQEMRSRSGRRILRYSTR